MQTLSSHSQANATLKIKGCCDRCALSKVKCDRLRPVCGRCVTIGRDLGIAPPCNYSVSLRTLKKTCIPAKNSRRTSQSQHERSNPQTPTGQRATPSSDSQDSQKQQQQQCYFSNSHSGDLQQSMKPEPAPMYDPSLWDGGFGNDMLLDGFDSNTSTPVLNDQFVNAYLAYGITRPSGPYFGEQISSSSSSSSSSSADSLYSTESSRSSSNASTVFQSNPMDLLGLETASLFTSDSHGCCAARICTTVQTLWKVSKRSACDSPSQPQVTTLDQALLLCRNALESIASVWKCPCADQPGSEFSSAFIIHAALSFFRGIIQGILGETHKDSGMMTFETPVQMGVYTMDAEDELRFKLQLVRSELGKISKIVEEFSKRFCDGTSTDFLGQAQPSEMLKKCLNMELESCRSMLEGYML